MHYALTIPFALTLAGGFWIFAGFVVLWVFVVAYGYYTRRGSGINQHPYADLDHNSGPESPSQLAHDVSQDVKNWDRGVDGRHRRRDRPVTRRSDMYGSKF